MKTKQLTIETGSKVHFVWVNGTTSHLILRGADFFDIETNQPLDVTDKPYLSLTIEPPKA